MKSFRVLVVDDEEEFVTTLVKRLNKRGADCEGVLSGSEAIARIRENQFDVVLLDMNLPDMGGNETLQKIKEIRPDIQVVILTGHASAKGGREGLQKGAFDYLMKPVEFESLLDKLREATNEKIEISNRGFLIKTQQYKEGLTN